MVLTRNALRELVCEANLELVRRGLVLYTWGNVSMIDRQRGEVAIKPSGVEYDRLRPEDIVILDLDGRVLEGAYRPSSDTPTHLVLYRAFERVGGIVHTHSTHATAFAQARLSIPCLGTTHADYFYGEIPVTRELTAAQIAGDYEKETGNVIVETFAQRDATHTPGVLVASHGPFAWGKDAGEAVYHAAVLEEVARMAALTLSLRPGCPSASGAVVEKHFSRKHGPNAYYGQDR